MRETKQIQLGDATLEITAWGGLEGLDVFVRLLAALGPALAPVAEKLIKGATDVDSLDLTSAIGGLRHLSPVELRPIVEALAGATVLVQSMQGQGMGGAKVKTPLDVDAFFAGRISLLLVWLKEGIVFNFRDFSGSVTQAPTSRSQAEKAASAG